MDEGLYSKLALPAQIAVGASIIAAKAKIWRI
jgi:hypothetical protein